MQLPSLTTGRFKRLSSLTMGEVGHTVRKLGEGGGQGPETGGVGTGAQDPCSISSSRMGYSMVAGLDEEAVGVEKNLRKNKCEVDVSSYSLPCT